MDNRLFSKPDSFTDALCEEYPQIRPVSEETFEFGNPFSTIRKGAFFHCTDLNSYYALEKGIACHKKTFYLNTVVIAVDTAQTGFCPESWEDLGKAELPVSYLFSTEELPFFLGAMSYGLEGEHFTLKKALLLLEKLQTEDLLTEEDPSAPVLICTDTRAFRLAAQGRDLKIFIPREGTLSYPSGLLAAKEIPDLSRETLLKHHLRLPDGSCLSPVCPPKEAYARAGFVKDPAYFSAVTHDSLRDFRRHVLHIRLFTSADGQESILFITAAILLSLFWMRTALHRAIHPKLKRSVFLFSALLTGWMLIRLYKYQCPDPFLSRMCWYSFYIFLPGLPLLLLCISASMGVQKEEKRVLKWLIPFQILYPVMVGLVFTNDLHQLVFRFDLQGNWMDEYTYGPVYYMIYAYCGITLFLALYFLIKKSRKSPVRFAFLLPAGLILLIFSYTAGYIKGVPLARESDLTMVICLFSLLFFESMLRTGLIPTNTHYKSLFTTSPLKMQLLDRKGNVRYAAASAGFLSEEEKKALMQEENTCLFPSGDLILYGKRIPGGTVVWENDISELNRLQEQIRESVKKLEAANLLLHKEEEIRHQKKASEIKSALFDTLEKEIREQTKELSSLIRELPGQKDKDSSIACITLLLCHIKRRCNLFFLAQENPCIHGDELAFYLDELSEFAGYANTRALVRCGISTNIDIKFAIFFYDFYFNVLFWNIKNSRATLLGQLEEKQDHLIFHILCPVSTDGLAFSDSFKNEISSLQGNLHTSKTEDSSEISLIFQRKEETV